MPELERTDQQLILRISETEREEYLAEDDPMKALLYAVRVALDCGYLLTNAEDLTLESCGAIRHLTSSPLITYQEYYSQENDRLLGYEELFWYPDYQTQDPFDLLLSSLVVAFQQA